MSVTDDLTLYSVCSYHFKPRLTEDQPGFVISIACHIDACQVCIFHDAFTGLPTFSVSTKPLTKARLHSFRNVKMKEIRDCRQKLYFLGIIYCL